MATLNAKTNTKTTSASSSSPRLKGFYYLAELSGEFLLVVCGFAMFVYRQYFPWVTSPIINLWVFTLAFVFHFLFFTLRERTGKKVFFALARYTFLVFFCLTILNTGAADSPFIFMLIFPLLASTAYLDLRSTKHIAFIVVTFMAFMFALDPRMVSDPGFITAHLIEFVLYALIAFYLYQIVNETLRQKFEKEQANRRLYEVVELDRIKTVFITIAQHQLRTPLSGVRWALENLLKEAKDSGMVSQDTVPILQESYRKVEESLAIVGEMLKTAESDVEAFSYNKHKEKIDVAVMLDHIIAKLDYLIKKNKVTCIFEKSDGYIIVGNNDTLEPALTNIIDNAVRYSPNGQVTIALRGEKNQVEIEVKDTGVGIDPEDQHYIFERFYRGKNAIAIDPNESGIGLYSSKKIIEFYGGKLTFASEVGKGSTFTVILPRPSSKQ